MKSHNKHILIVGVLLITLIYLSSCSRSESDQPISIVGKWTLKSMKETYRVNDSIVYDSLVNLSATSISFTDRGHFVAVSKDTLFPGIRPVMNTYSNGNGNGYYIFRDSNILFFDSASSYRVAYNTVSIFSLHSLTLQRKDSQVFSPTLKLTSDYTYYYAR